jgi:segregation and condensation protein A
MDTFQIETTRFSGPLDALLTLIEDRKLSITEVSLAEVTDAYLAYVEKLPELPLAETAQFILVASTLLLIKSRTLLPTVDLTQEESQSIHELERRLARYALIRKAAKALRAQWGIAPLIFSRRQPRPEYTGGRIASFNPGEATIATIQTATARLVSLLPKVAKLAEATVAPVLALEDVMRDLKDRLTRSIRTSWKDMTKSASKHDLIVHFLAVLELVRHGSLSATQDKLFSDILLETEALGAPKY